MSEKQVQHSLNLTIKSTSWKIGRQHKGINSKGDGHLVGKERNGNNQAWIQTELKILKDRGTIWCQLSVLCHDLHWEHTSSRYHLAQFGRAHAMKYVSTIKVPVSPSKGQRFQNGRMVTYIFILSKMIHNQF